MEKLYHTAAFVSIRDGDRQQLFDVNVLGTRYLMQEARRAGVNRVVHTSSFGAVGINPDGASNEKWTVSPFETGSDYERTKSVSEYDVLQEAIENEQAYFFKNSERMKKMNLKKMLISGKILLFVLMAVFSWVYSEAQGASAGSADLDGDGVNEEIFIETNGIKIVGKKSRTYTIVGSFQILNDNNVSGIRDLDGQPGKEIAMIHLTSPKTSEIMVLTHRTGTIRGYGSTTGGYTLLKSGIVQLDGKPGYDIAFIHLVNPTQKEIRVLTHNNGSYKMTSYGRTTGTYTLARNGIVDVDGYSGREIVMFRLTGTNGTISELVVFTARTGRSKTYARTTLNLTLCTNAFVNLDGVPGREIRLFHSGRSSGITINHRFGIWKRTTGCSDNSFPIPNASPCRATSAISFTNKTSTAVAVWWNKVSYATQYEFAARIRGTTDWYTAFYPANQRSQRFTGLPAGSSWDVRIKTICGSNRSSWKYAPPVTLSD